MHGPALDIFHSGLCVRVRHRATDVHIDVRVRTFSSSFGCHFLVQVFIPFSYCSDETILGLMGTPNSNRGDDWTAPDGTILATPSTQEDSIFAPLYNYCVENWCIHNANMSLFTYGRNEESFEIIYACDEDYASDIETAILNPPPDLTAICGTNIFCL